VTHPPADRGGRIESVFYIGHSLLGNRIPAYTNSIAEANGNGRDDFKFQYNWYSPLIDGWNKSTPSYGVVARQELAQTSYDALVMTPGLPLLKSLEFAGTDDYAARFADIALSRNADTEVYLFQSWPDRGRDFGGDFFYSQGTTLPFASNWADQVVVEYQAMLDLARKVDQRIQRQHPGAKKVTVIPAGMAIRELSIAIGLGQFPASGGLKTTGDLFSDPLHLTDLGMALASAVTYAEMYRDDPADGLDIAKLKNASGGTIFLLPDDAAAALYGIAWNIAQRY
jgi:hypothetical protein